MSCQNTSSAGADVLGANEGKPSCITESGIIGIERRGSGVGKAWKASVPGMVPGECSIVAMGADVAAETCPSADSSMFEARFRNGTQSLWSFAMGGLNSLTSER